LAAGSNLTVLPPALTMDWVGRSTAGGNVGNASNALCSMPLESFILNSNCGCGLLLSRSFEFFWNLKRGAATERGGASRRGDLEAVEAGWASPREGVEQGSALNRLVNFFPTSEAVLVNFHLIPRKSMSQQDASRSAAEGAHIAG